MQDSRSLRPDMRRRLLRRNAPVPFGHEHFILGAIVNQSRNNLSLLLQRNGNRPMWDAMHKIVRAVQRVYNPDIVRIAAFNLTAFFHHEEIIGAGLF